MQGWRTSSSCKPWWKFTLTGELTWHEGRRNQTSWKKTGTGHLGLSCCEPTVLIPLLQLCSDKHQRLHRPKMESLLFLFLFRLAGPVFYEQSRRLHIKLPPLPYSVLWFTNHLYKISMKIITGWYSCVRLICYVYICESHAQDAGLHFKKLRFDQIFFWSDVFKFKADAPKPWAKLHVWQTFFERFFFVSVSFETTVTPSETLIKINKYWPSHYKLSSCVSTEFDAGKAAVM